MPLVITTQSGDNFWHMKRQLLTQAFYSSRVLRRGSHSLCKAGGSTQLGEYSPIKLAGKWRKPDSSTSDHNNANTLPTLFDAFHHGSSIHFVQPQCIKHAPDVKEPNLVNAR